MSKTESNIVAAQVKLPQDRIRRDHPEPRLTELAHAPRRAGIRPDEGSGGGC